MFTDKYIKMCEQATKIQEGWKPETGDWTSKGIIGEQVFFDSPEHYEIIGFVDSYAKENLVFLPLQHLT